MQHADFAVFNVDRLVTGAPGCHPSAAGPLGVIERGALAAAGGKVVWVGTMEELQRAVHLSPDATVLNTHGRTVLPGFVDPHTHPVFAGDRSGDFYARARGERYEEQLESGGIMHTVRATRACDEDTLLGLALERADRFMQYGTTTIQAKTGYGLTADSELKSLRVLNRLQRLHPVKIVPCFLGAHVVPADYPGSADDFVEEVARDWLPAARPCSDFADTWCDPDVFTETQCRRLLGAARDLGFQLTLHASELAPGAGVRLAAEFGARSVDHAVYLEDRDIDALRNGQTVPVLLPGTTFFLGSDEYAPAQRLLDAGIPTAIGTDFNPGTSFTQNMQFVLTLAVLKLGMSAEEAILAATANAARAIGMADLVGTLEPGKFCDLAVYRVPHERVIPYAYAMNLVEDVVVNGSIAVRDGKLVVGPRPLASVS